LEKWTAFGVTRSKACVAKSWTKLLRLIPESMEIASLPSEARQTTRDSRISQLASSGGYYSLDTGAITFLDEK
jgi:hypothetical protein